MGASQHFIGPGLVVAGAVLIVIGILAWSGGFNWFGHLPGDLRIERETFKIYVPFVSMLLLSVVMSLILYLLRRFL